VNYAFVSFILELSPKMGRVVDPVSAVEFVGRTKASFILTNALSRDILARGTSCWGTEQLSTVEQCRIDGKQLWSNLLCAMPSSQPTSLVERWGW